MRYFRSPENRDSSPGLARRLRSCSRLDRVRPETLATPLRGDSLKPSDIAPIELHKSKTSGPLVPPFWVRPPRGPNPTIRLAGEPALFHIISSVRVVGFVGADPEQRQARSNSRVSWLAQACWKPPFGAHISSGIFFTVSMPFCPKAFFMCKIRLLICRGVPVGQKLLL